VAGKPARDDSGYIPVTSFNPSSSGCGWKTFQGDLKSDCGRMFQSFFFWMWLENNYGNAADGAYLMFQSFFFWMWLENAHPQRTLPKGLGVSILLLLDVAGKRVLKIHSRHHSCRKFQSFFFWMWLENHLFVSHEFFSPKVSILLLLDVAGKRVFWLPSLIGDTCFNPSSSGCGWKTFAAFHPDR